MGHFSQLLAYQKSFSLAMDIFHASNKFPLYEKYSLTDQVKRSSRSVAANITEGYRKRFYPKLFLSKLYDSYAENSETEVWLRFALDCNYLEKEVFESLLKKNDEVGRLLAYMIKYPEKFCL